MEPLDHVDTSPYRQPGSPVIVGRNREQDMLRETLKTMFRGHGRLIIVSGEVGIGKTSLVNWLAKEAGQDGACVLAGSCYDLETTPGYGPWMEIIRDYPDNCGLPPLPNKLSRIESDRENIDSQAEFFDLIGRWLSRAADECPHVILLEDLQWADQSSLDLLRYVSRMLLNHPLLLIATYRDEEVAGDHPVYRLLPTLVHEGRVHRIPLRRLDREAVLALTRIHCRLPVGDEGRLVDYLKERADGNPFFALELLHMLREHGVLVPDDGGWRLGDLSESGVPTILEQVIIRRLSSLNADARVLIDLAAVIGHEASLEHLQELYPGTALELDNALQSALQQKLLILRNDYEAVRFSHDLIRQTVYELLAPLRRRRIHRQYGELLATHIHPDLDAVADHMYKAGDERALGWLVRAAERSQQRFAPESVMVRYQQAVELAERLGGTPPVSVYRLQGLALETTGDLEGARVAHEKALEAANEHGDQHAEWQALLDLGAYWASRDYVRSKEYLEQALAVARTIDDPVALGQSLNRVGNWYVNVDQPENGLRCHQDALDIFERIGDSAGTASTLDLIGMTHLLTGDAARSVEYFNRAIPLLRELDDRQTLVTALVTSSAARFGTEHALYGSNMHHRQPESYDERHIAIDEAMEIANDIGWRSGKAFALALSSRTAQVFGDYDRAFRDGHSAVEIARNIGHAQWEVLAHCSVGATFGDLLEFERARFHFEQALDVAKRTRSLFMVGLATSFLATNHVLCGELELAESLIETEIDGRSTAATTAGRLNSWYVLAKIKLARGEPDDALELLNSLDDSLPGPPDRRAPSLHMLRGQALIADEQYAEAERALIDAMESATEFGHLPLLWRTVVARSSLYLEQGRVEEVETMRRKAWDIIEKLISSLSDDELREHFRRSAGAQVPERLPFLPSRGSGSALRGLTAREREVLELVAQGLTDVQVSERLGISPRTVSQHLRSVYTRLDVTNRTAAVRVANELDLLQ